MILSEWKITPEKVFRTWTRELLSLLIEKRADRLERIREIREEPAAAPDPPPWAPKTYVSEAEFFNRRYLNFPKGIQIKKVEIKGQGL